MSIAESLLPEFDHEFAQTKKTLERVPDGKFDWSPHDKSFSLGGLVSHMSALPMWATTTLHEDSFNMAPADGEMPEMPKVSNSAEAVKMFEASTAQAREALAGMSDEALHRPWSLMAGEEILWTKPRVAVFRTMIMNHMIHHRAQLGVYLRLLDAPVPALYGPSADEQSM